MLVIPSDCGLVQLHIVPAPRDVLVARFAALCVRRMREDVAAKVRRDAADQLSALGDAVLRPHLPAVLDAVLSIETSTSTREALLLLFGARPHLLAAYRDRIQQMIEHPYKLVRDAGALLQKALAAL